MATQKECGIRQNFSAALAKYLSSRGALNRNEISEIVGVSAAHISGISLNKSGGSEDLRRKIAKAIGLSYDDMISLGPECVRLPGVGEKDPTDIAAAEHGVSKIPSLCYQHAVPLISADIAGLAALWPDAMNQLAMVPLIRLAAVMYGRPPGEGDIMGWVAAPVRDPSPSVVAVRLGRSDIARLTGDVAEWLMVVDTAQREVVDGSWYLLRPPARIPVQRCFRQPGMIIMMRGDGDSASGPQVIDLGAFPDVVVGRVVAGMVQM